MVETETGKVKLGKTSFSQDKQSHFRDAEGFCDILNFLRGVPKRPRNHSMSAGHDGAIMHDKGPFGKAVIGVF